LVPLDVEELIMSKTVEPAIGGYSPVSYFESNRAERGRPEHQASYQGQTYYFTSAAQVVSFQANPAKYVPAFGGTCAIGHSVGKEFQPDPTSFKIVDGRLLLFLKTAEVDARALWNKEGDAACLVKASRHWEQSQRT
jgi:YHS domain-containing protein